MANAVEFKMVANSDRISKADFWRCRYDHFEGRHRRRWNPKAWRL